jgi:lipopolysaccharide/colanic/teichoic acid biosynthesis glycosyltransferase
VIFASEDQSRRALLADLERLYSGGRLGRWRAARKRLAWRLVVGGTHAVKRAIDIVGSLAGLILCAPLLLVVAACIKATDRGPVFYIAPRVGKHGRTFPFPKFRSMVVDAEARLAKLREQNQHADAKTFKMKRDPRITWIGRIIRRLSIDELPQLWCVLRGYMSLVGPRPPVPSEVATYTLADRRRLVIKPGLTCIWQISGRSEIPFPEQLRLDLLYIRSRSLRTDLSILLRTVPAVLVGKGAY